MLWDRKLIKALFDFDYKWEIYTPKERRKYGYYTMPILYGDRFVGRMEAACDRKKKTLIVKNIWHEKDIKPTKILQAEINGCINRLANFNECEYVSWADNSLLTRKRFFCDKDKTIYINIKIYKGFLNWQKRYIFLGILNITTTQKNKTVI
ncbi:MAG TPA: hypothetical protein GX745_05230 [Clostridiales bacterium]|nr:hypothetical protein [Clostridiales bacterium]